MELDTATPPDADAIDWKDCRSFVRPAPRRATPVEIDPSRVWMTSDHALRFWTRELDATIYEIRDAVAATGSRCAEAVRRYLGRTPRGSGIQP